MKTVFVDIIYFNAALSPDDAAHELAIDFAREFAGPMLTTAWVLIEVADGMAAPVNRAVFIQLLADLRADPQFTILPPDEELFEKGLELYAYRLDKGWSLTDCISFVVMQRADITDALTGDHHFEQAGFRALFK